MKNLFILLLSFGVTAAFGQYQIGIIPRVSPDKAIFHKLGLTEINITYGSPSVKGRTVWGDLVPWNKVWRAGANNATTIECSTDILFNDKRVPAGKYALFVLPYKDSTWTVILSKQAKQWGAFRYNQDDDLLRTQILPTTRRDVHEKLTYTIHQHDVESGEIILSWENINLNIPIQTEYAELFIQSVENRATTLDDTLKSVLFIQGAEHLLDIKKNYAKSLEWINTCDGYLKSFSKWNKQYYPLDYVKGHAAWIRIRAHHEKNNLSADEKAIELFKADHPLYYERNQEKIDNY